MQNGHELCLFPIDKVYVNAGLFCHHVNSPRESFFGESSTVDNRIPIRHIGFLNGSFKVNDQWIVNPNIYFSSRQKHLKLSVV